MGLGLGASLRSVARLPVWSVDLSGSARLCVVDWGGVGVSFSGELSYGQTPAALNFLSAGFNAGFSWSPSFLSNRLTLGFESGLWAYSVVRATSPANFHGFPGSIGGRFRGYVDFAAIRIDDLWRLGVGVYAGVDVPYDNEWVPNTPTFGVYINAMRRRRP